MKRTVGLVAVLLVGCGSAGPARPAEPSAAAAEESASPASDGPAEEGEGPAEIDGARVIGRVADAGRAYALLARARTEDGADAACDAALGMAEYNIRECVSGEGEIPCRVELYPALECLFVDLAVQEGASYEVVALEGDRVVARRPLVGLSFAPREGDVPLAVGAGAIRLGEYDSDPHAELMVSVPVRPLRDDGMIRDALDERGSVSFVLDARSLDVEARFTDEIRIDGTEPDDGESDEAPGPLLACTTLPRIDDVGALVLSRACEGEPGEREITCPHDAATDRHRCPDGFAQELFTPLPSDLGRHYVGDTFESIAAQFPTLGARHEEARAWVDEHEHEWE